MIWQMDNAFDLIMTSYPDIQGLIIDKKIIAWIL